MRRPKIQTIVAIGLLLIGTNLFTYATTRYLITKQVLTRAQERMSLALQDAGVFEEALDNGGAAFQLAIPMAGGMYYWWNDGLIWWGSSVLVFLLGFLLLFGRFQIRT